MTDDADGYTGPAELVTAAEPVEVSFAVHVTLAGRFDPILGSYRWYGRVAASPDVAALLASGTRDIVLRTPHRAVETTLSDVDPWGRPRVQGFGAPPFEVLGTVSD